MIRTSLALTAFVLSLAGCASTAPAADAQPPTGGCNAEGARWAIGQGVNDDVVNRIARLKQEDGPELQVHGSAQLLQTLNAHNLVDEYHLLTFPVVLGSGKRLFRDGAAPSGLRLARSRTSPSGVIIATYERAGDVQYGTFGEE